MPAPDPFVGLQFEQHTDRIEQAAVDLMIDDPYIMAWTSGRIFRLTDPLQQPDRQPPYIVAGAEFLNTDPSLQRLQDVRVRLQIVGIFEERRDVIEANSGQLSAKSIDQRLRLIFFNGEQQIYLTVPRYDNQLLVDRVTDLLPIEYGNVTRAQPNYDPEAAISPNDILRYLNFGIEYEFEVALATWEKTGFTLGEYGTPGYVEAGYGT